jgi:hypothetical protein
LGTGVRGGVPSLRRQRVGLEVQPRLIRRLDVGVGLELVELPLGLAVHEKATCALQREVCGTLPLQFGSIIRFV